MSHQMTQMNVEPFFFGAARRQMFGCYHEPREPARDCGVVICAPLLREQIHAHRACHQLAGWLARAGFPCLRFDYRGTGDSAGDLDEMRVKDWTDDISAAIEELRDRAGVGAISLVGLRVGATLAATVAAARNDVESLVLWEPVVDGGAMIEQHKLWHHEMLMNFFVMPSRPADPSRPEELLGFALTDKLLDDLLALDMLALQRRPTRTILMVESSVGTPGARLAERLTTLGARVTHQHIESFPLWTVAIDNGQVHIPTLTALTDWLSEVHQ